MVAAVAWGIADFYVAVLGRRIGWFRTTVGMGIAAAAVATGAFFIFSPSGAISSRDWLGMVALSMVVVPVLFTFYRALEAGPVAIVTPVVTAYAAIVVVLSLLLLKERLNAGQWLGVIGAIGGVAFASADFRRLPHGTRRVTLGVWLGIASMVGFGFTSFASGFFAQKYGWLMPSFFVRVMVTGMIAALAAARNEWPWQRAGTKLMVVLLLVGAVEFTGFLAFARGAELGFVSIVAAASASYPLIPLIMGIVVFRERLAPNQVLGIAVVLGAVFLLAISG